MGDYLNNLKANRKMYEDSLVNLQSELTEARNKLRLGNHIREEGFYHMGQDVGHNPPSGVKYLENLELIIIPNLQNRIYIANDNIERLTSRIDRIESLEPIAVPAAEAVVEDMTQGAHSAASAVFPEKLRGYSSSSSEGEGRKKRRRNNRRKSRRKGSHRKGSHRRKSHKHRSTRRNKRKSKKKP